jgi:ribonuclease Z
MRPIIHCHLVNGPFGDSVVYGEVMFERRAFLFDLGEIAALPPRKVLRVSHIFVSHTHIDHFCGFDRLLRLLLGRDKSVALYGPTGFIDQLEHKLRAYTWNVIHRYAGNLVFHVYEIHGDGTLRHACFQSVSAFLREDRPEMRGGDELPDACSGFRVRCAVLDHGTPCLGFALEEAAHVNIWKTRLNALGLSVGPWLRDFKRAILDDAPETTPIQAMRHDKQGSRTIILPLGELRGLVQIVAGQKIAYIVDVRGHAANAERIKRLAFGADLLFMECTFLEEDAAHALRKNHLTAWRAGVLAQQAQVKRFVPCHFSTRYTGREDLLLAEAQRAFRGPIAFPGTDAP